MSERLGATAPHPTGGAYSTCREDISQGGAGGGPFRGGHGGRGDLCGGGGGGGGGGGRTYLLQVNWAHPSVLFVWAGGGGGGGGGGGIAGYGGGAGGNGGPGVGSSNGGTARSRQRLGRRGASSRNPAGFDGGDATSSSSGGGGGGGGGGYKHGGGRGTGGGGGAGGGGGGGAGDSFIASQVSDMRFSTRTLRSRRGRHHQLHAVASAIQITSISYKLPQALGTGRDQSLNAEWICLRNMSQITRRPRQRIAAGERATWAGPRG